MQGKEIRIKLKLLIREASTIDPPLTRRLEEIDRWIGTLKPGALIAKPRVVAFLLEILTDATVWLEIQAIPSQAEKQAAFEKMTPPEQYWYQELFPRWVASADPKFHIWRQKLKAGEPEQTDGQVIRDLAKIILRLGGKSWRRYIVDLSMATDLIVSYRQNRSLCTQLTTLTNTQQKYEDWQTTLQNWKILRGLFISYNPARSDFILQLADLVLDKSDNLQDGIYSKSP